MDLWLGVNARSYLLEALRGLEAGAPLPDGACSASFLKDRSRLPPEQDDDNPPRLLTTPPATAYLKIAEGCSHGCSYCLIPRIRGGLASRPLEAICQEAARLVAHGVREINLVAQDTGSYGRDLYGKPSLDLVIRRLAALPDLRWLRIMYLNPYSLTPDLLAVIQDEEKVCRYLDLPFQHASARVLRLMNRPGSLAANLRTRCGLEAPAARHCLAHNPDDRFSRRGRHAFRELLSFVEQAGFERLGVFAYCHEEGAASFRRRETVSFIEKQHRRRQLYRLQRQISRQTNDAIIGQDLAVLIERQVGAGVYLGRSYREAPDVDPKIIVRGDGLRPGDFTRVKITRAYAFDLAGIVANTSDNAKECVFPMLS